MIQKYGKITVNIVHHPAERFNVSVFEVPYRRQTVAELQERFAAGRNVIAAIDKMQIEPGARAFTYVRPGSRVVFMPAAAGAVAAWILTTLASPAFWGQLILAFAISYIGATLFNQDLEQPKRTDRAAGQSFGWNPDTTMAAGLPSPQCFGTNMHYGNVVARWTDVDGSGDEILYMIVDSGEGPIEGRGANIVYLNDQPVGNYPGVTVQERTGTFNQTAMTGFEQNKLPYRPGWEITNTDGPATFTTPNNFFDDIEYTLEFTRGLWHFRDDGDRTTGGCGVKVEISERGLSSWTTLMDTTVTGNQLAPIYKAYKVSDQGFSCVHGKQYDLKLTKTSTDLDAARNGDTLKLREVREVVDVAFTRPGRALLGITALATERLSGHITVKWISEDRLVETYNGSSWSVEFSRNRAWVALSMLTQPVISGDGGANPWAIERYEGLDPSRVDLAFIYEWAEWCDDQVTDGNGGTEARMTCDLIVDYETDVFSLVYEISQIGRMYPYWQGVILTGWVDKEESDGVFDLITFDNIMVRSWKSAWGTSGEKAGGVDVFFKDALAGYERKSLPAHNEDAGLYTRRVSIEGTGVTGAAMARRIGNHAVQRNKLITNMNSVRMYKDALRLRLGKVIRLQGTVPNWGAAYRVVSSAAADTVTLDRDCAASAGDIVFIRSYDEINEQVSIDSYTVSSVSGNVLTIAETWDITPVKNNILAVGAAGAVKLRRIVKMRYAADNYFDVDLETYDATLFDSDDTDPNIDNPDYAWPQPRAELVQPLTQQQVRGIVAGMLPPSPDIDIPWTSNCDWAGDSVDTVTWSKRNSDEPILFRYRGTSYEITPDSTTDEYIYWDPNYTDQFRTTNVSSVALASGKWIVCMNKDGEAYPANPMQVLHAGIFLAGTIRAEHYLELRNTYTYNGDDSLDSSKPLEIPFKIVSETTAIVSVKLSFRIMPYRAYSTAASSGGASTSGSGGGQTSSSGGATTSEGATGWPTNIDTSTVDPGDTNDEDLSTHNHTALNGNTQSGDGDAGSHTHVLDGSGAGTNDANLGVHSHTMPSHKHTVGLIDHTHDIDNHTHTVSDHTHSTPNHTHGVSYGIHEESNSPTVHYHIDNGAGFGAPSGNYTSDEIDIDISGSITGTGWKAIRFDTDLRCRIAAIIEAKLDITA